MTNDIHDLIIIGGSAAATAAGIYAARRNLKFRIITKEFGGEVATSGEIGNWPGITQTDGLALADQFRKHLDFYHVAIDEGIEVSHIQRQDDGLFCITTKKRSMGQASDKIENSVSQGLTCDYQAKAVLIATGVHPRELGIPGEKEFRNKGVSYCTVCDGPLFAGKVVVTIGGGNAALESALMLSDIATKVYIINKNADFKGEQVLIDNVKSKKNIEIIPNVLTKSIQGESFVNGVEYELNGESKKLAADGVFVHIGMTPNSNIVSPDVQKNDYGEIVVNERGETSIAGLFAAGDVTNVAHKQIIIAAGQGCIALLSAVNYLNRTS